MITTIAGWIPAIILPIAALLQLIEILRKKNVAGVSFTAWLLFGIANIGLYFFTEKYYAIQSLLGLLGTAVLNFIIASLVLILKKSSHSD